MFIIFFVKVKQKYLIIVCTSNYFFTYICKTKLKDMTKEEEFAVKVFQKAKDVTLRNQAMLAIERDLESEFIHKILKNIEEMPNLIDWYIQLLGEDLYNELQKFKTEK